MMREREVYLPCQNTTNTYTMMMMICMVNLSLQSMLVAGQLESSREAKRCVDELNECRQIETHLLQILRDGLT